MKAKDLKDRTVAELRKMATSAGLRGASRMKKAELVAHLSGPARGRPPKGGSGSRGASSVEKSSRKTAKRASRTKTPAAGPSRSSSSTGKRKPAARRKSAAKTPRESAGKRKSAAKRKPLGSSPRKPAAKRKPSGSSPRKADGTSAVKRSGRGAAKKPASRRQAGGADVTPVISPWLKRTFSRVTCEGEQRAKVSKYYLGVSEPGEPEERFEYPETYGENVISLMVRDPYWLFAYWEFAPELRAELASRIGEDALLRSRTVLRVYDVTGADPEHPAGQYDIDIATEARNWYINVARVEREYCVDIGLIAPDGSFITIARSNRVALPPVGPSDDVDEEWVAIDALSELYIRVDAHRGGPTSGSGGWGSGGFGR